MSLLEPLRNSSRLFSPTFRTASRCILVAMWLLDAMLMESGSAPALFLIPVLALLSFLLSDYFSSAVIAVLLTKCLNMLLITQIPGSTRAWLFNAIWLAAAASVAVKVLHRFDKMADTSDMSASLSWPVNLRHDLQTPISMILGYCAAIFRADQAKEKSGSNGSVFRDNVQAIYRNAQQLETLLAGFFDQQAERKPMHLNKPEAFDLSVLIQETLGLLGDLLMSRGIKADVLVDTQLPKLALNRLYVRQILLNIFRAIALAPIPSDAKSHIHVSAKVYQQGLQLSITALATSIRYVTTGVSWLQSDKLLQIINARARVEEPIANKVQSSAASNSDQVLILSFPLPTESIAMQMQSHREQSKTRADEPAMVVVSAAPGVLDFFQEQLEPYKIVSVRDIDALAQLPQHIRVNTVALLSAQVLSDNDLRRASDWLGGQTPILMYPVSTAQELMQQLTFAYLPKPIDFNTLWAILSSTVNSSLLPTMNILIVEDNLDSAEMLAQMITTSSPLVNIQRVFLGQTALAHLDQYPVSAILVDLSLPDMDGIALIQRIRQQDAFTKVPIVLMSAYPNLESAVPIIPAKMLMINQPNGFESLPLAAYINTLDNQMSRNNRRKKYEENG